MTKVAAAGDSTRVDLKKKIVFLHKSSLLVFFARFPIFN